MQLKPQSWLQSQIQNTITRSVDIYNLALSYTDRRGQAIETAKVKDVTKCYFVDDNRRNVEVAAELGWGHVVHFCEEGLEHMEGGKVKAIEQESISDTAGISAIKDLEELRVLWPEIFHST